MGYYYIQYTFKNEKRAHQDIIISVQMSEVVGRLLGKGTFSQVYLVEKDGRLYAYKKLITPLKASIEFLLTELNIIRTCNHPNIIRCYGMEMNSFLSVDFKIEYVNGGTLKDAYRQKNEQLLFFWAYQILKAFIYLEQNHIVHRDIKPHNILVHQSGIVKVSDFGAAKFLSVFDCKSDIVGTPAFLPPELLISNQYTYKSDIWSLGISLYELAHGYTPFPNCTTKQQFFKCLLRGKIQYDSEQCSSQMQSLISCMLRRNPVDRKSAGQLLQHPSLQIRKDKFEKMYYQCLKDYYESQTSP